MILVPKWILKNKNVMSYSIESSSKYFHSFFHWWHQVPWMKMNVCDEIVQLCQQWHDELWYSHAQNLINLSVFKSLTKPQIIWSQKTCEHIKMHINDTVPNLLTTSETTSVILRPNGKSSTLRNNRACYVKCHQHPFVC